ncbi:MAG: FAD-binding and (Fe-S)-binding domain-containing protein [Acidimicrobiales bacterium]
MTIAPGSHVDRSNLDEGARQRLARELSAALRGEVHFDGATRGIYATDSSNYRQVPLGVIMPMDEDDVVRAVEICRRHGAPILGRGAGTSLAGQACNVAVVFDMSRHMNRILEIDPVRRIARVQPGVVLDDLNAAARSLDLTFGPDPATHAWCTVGGMIGNNSCGTHALYAGKTVDNVEQLKVVTYAGTQMQLGALSDDEYLERASNEGEAATILKDLRELRAQYSEAIRGGFPDIARRVSGFNLDQLLPEQGFHLARAIVGSESTCVLVTEATLRLSHWPRHRSLVVLGFEDIYVAADYVAQLLEHPLIGLEGFDSRLIEQMRRSNLHVRNLRHLPVGGGWLLCEIGADDVVQLEERTAALVASLSDSVQSSVLRDEHDQHEVWQIRESGLGATAHPVGQAVNYEGWEDAAVAPQQLGRYLRGIRDLWKEFGYEGAWYGHFGQGCVHTRNNFDLSSVAGLANYRNFVERAADLCVSLGGSISGEHGDGQARGELLARMYGPELMAAFQSFKSIWDPSGMMNPGKLVDAFPLDTNIRYGPTYRRSSLKMTNFAFAEDGGSLQNAVERCVGVGKCRSNVSGVMCPSFRATGDETHSTRGRAKLLVELFQGETTPESWRNQEVFEALDLCLSCKGCAVDCPTHVDMATYKAEFLSHYYDKRVRPRYAYALGLLPWIGRRAARGARLVNGLLANRRTGRILKTLAGISTERPAPAFANPTFRRSGLARQLGTQHAPTVVLWPDTFTDLFWPERGVATAEVLSHAGERVVVPSRWACCGRTLYDSGMLKRAKNTARDVLDILEPYLEAGVPVVVPEPSCLATFRDEIPKLLAEDPRAAMLATLSRSLSEHLALVSWTAPQAPHDGRTSVHPHCHQRAVQGTGSDREVLEGAGFDVEILDLGCCGLAGSFGYNARHDELSRQIARDRFLPAIERLAETSSIVADGFSCRLQTQHLSRVQSTSIAELLAQRIRANPPAHEKE